MPGGVDGQGSNLHPGAFHFTLVNGFLNIGIGVASTFCSQVTDSGETIEQTLFGAFDRADGSVRDGLFEHLHVIVFAGDIALQ